MTPLSPVSGPGSASLRRSCRWEASCTGTGCLQPDAAASHKQHAVHVRAKNQAQRMAWAGALADGAGALAVAFTGALAFAAFGSRGANSNVTFPPSPRVR